MLPKLPTDNLYKFLAIGGMALFCFCLWLPMQLQDEISPEMARTKNEICEITSGTEKLLGRDKQSMGIEGPFRITPGCYLNLTTDENQFTSYREFLDELDGVLSVNCNPDAVREKLRTRATDAKKNGESFRIESEKHKRETEKLKNQAQILRIENETHKDEKTSRSIDEIEEKANGSDFSSRWDIEIANEYFEESKRFNGTSEVKSQVDIAQNLRIKLHQHIITLENLWRLSQKEKYLGRLSRIGTFCGAIMAVVGFVLWWSLVQRHLDKLTKLQAEKEKQNILSEKQAEIEEHVSVAPSDGTGILPVLDAGGNGSWSPSI
jgi:hypothetical protein